MRRVVLWAALAGLMAPSLMAGDVEKKSKSGSQSSVEERLATTAELKLGEGETITFAELLDAIRMQHGLSVQLDRNAALLLAMTMEDLVLPQGEVAHLPKRQPKASPQPTYGSVWVPSGSQSLPSPAYLSDDVTYFPAGPDGPATFSPASETGAIYGALPVSDDELQGSATIVDPSKLPPAGDEPQDLQTPEQLPLPEADLIAPVAPDSEQAVKSDADSEASGESEEQFEPGLHALVAYEDMFRKSSINSRSLRDPEISVEVVLRRAIAQVGTLMETEEMMGMPTTYSHAYDWELRVENETVYITTRLQSNLQKVARVYRVPADMTPEELALVVRRTVRPWSWRQQIDDVVNMVRLELPEGMPFPQFPKIAKIDLTGSGELVQFASDEAPATEAVEESANSEKAKEDPALAWMSMKALGSLMSSGTVATAHTLVNTAEMLHFADPPTATIEVLPGMLVISQSRGAHVEIKELIEQISAGE